MGLRTTTRKLISISKFYLHFLIRERSINLDIENNSDIIILNPNPQDHVVIPKIVWIFWDGCISKFIETCINNIKKINPHYNVILLNNKNYAKYSDLDFTEYPPLTPQLKSDLLRLDLLYNHGGIWLDASTVLYENLDWIEKICQDNNTKSFGYYRLHNTKKKEYPVIESWLLATTKKNLFFKEWLEELKRAVKSGPNNYIKDLRKKIINHQDYFQNIGSLEYLVIYVACQVVQRNTRISISLINCDKNALFYQNEYGFGTLNLCIALMINKKPKKLPHLIKLIGSDRNVIIPLLEKPFIKIKKESLLDI